MNEFSGSGQGNEIEESGQEQEEIEEIKSENVIMGQTEQRPEEGAVLSAPESEQEVQQSEILTAGEKKIGSLHRKLSIDIENYARGIWHGLYQDLTNFRFRGARSKQSQLVDEAARAMGIAKEARFRQTDLAPLIRWLESRARHKIDNVVNMVKKVGGDPDEARKILWALQTSQGEKITRELKDSLIKLEYACGDPESAKKNIRELIQVDQWIAQVQRSVGRRLTFLETGSIGDIPRARERLQFEREYRQRIAKQKDATTERIDRRLRREWPRAERAAFGQHPNLIDRAKDFIRRIWPF